MRTTARLGFRVLRRSIGPVRFSIVPRERISKGDWQFSDARDFICQSTFWSGRSIDSNLAARRQRRKFRTIWAPHVTRKRRRECDHRARHGPLPGGAGMVWIRTSRTGRTGKNPPKGFRRVGGGQRRPPNGNCLPSKPGVEIVKWAARIVRA